MYLDQPPIIWWELLKSGARGIMDGGLCVLGKKASPSVPRKNGIFVVVQIRCRIVDLRLECNTVPSCLSESSVCRASLSMTQPGAASLSAPPNSPSASFQSPFGTENISS